jgi:hypothetical protein
MKASPFKMSRRQGRAFSALIFLFFIKTSLMTRVQQAFFGSIAVLAMLHPCPSMDTLMYNPRAQKAA